MWNIFKLGTWTIIKDQKNYKIFGSGDFTKRMIIEDKLCGFSIYLPNKIITNIDISRKQRNIVSLKVYVNR